MLAEGGPDRRLTVASTCGGTETLGEGAARAAMAGGAVVVRPETHGTVLAAPVRVTGEMAGSLIARLSGDHIVEQRDQLAAFAQQVSLALTDARTVEAVREAHHDPVTGLPNRTLFLKILNRVLASRATASDPTTVLFVDLDRFKAVNDSLGHEAGDQLLALVARRLRACVRASDTTARLGGDEFAAVLHDSPLEAAMVVGERIVASIKEPFRVAGREVFIGASVGIAISRSVAEPCEELLRQADVAMYRAKKDGTGRVLVYEPYMHAEALDHLNLRGDLQRPLREGEFRLQYQPLFRIADGVPTGGRGLDPLAQPDARLRLAGRLHPDRRGVRVDRRHRAVGAGDERHAGGAVAARLPGPEAQHQRFRPPAGASAVRRPRDAGARDCRAAVQRGHPGADRVGADERARPGQSGPAGLARAGGCSCRSTISVRATRRWPISGNSRSTS